jgi:D-alanine transaminase/branched-chain amino acid aminotransferase
MTKWVFIHEDFVKEDKALLSYRDLAFLRGYGVFDFFRLTGSEPLFLDDHLNRFYASANGLHLPAPVSREEIKELIRKLIVKNNLPGTGIRLSLTGGLSEDGFSIAQPHFIISQHGFTSPTRQQVDKGIKLFTHPFQRQLPSIKTIDYLTAIWLQPSLKEQGFDDALYYKDGFITECPRSNFFMVTGEDVIVTPSEGMLKGITRMKVLDVARQHFAVEERNIHIDEIKTAKEAFITSTTKQILPVSQIDGEVLQQKEISLHLLRLFYSASNAEQRTERTRE